MKIIALVSIAAVVLLHLSDAIAGSSVGGPMTILMVMLVAMLAVGVYDAGIKRRGPLGWLLSIVAAVVGGMIVAMAFSFVMEAVLGVFSLQGSLASAHPALFYLSTTAMAITTVFGSWLTLQIGSWFPTRIDSKA